MEGITYREFMVLAARGFWIEFACMSELVLRDRRGLHLERPPHDLEARAGNLAALDVSQLLNYFFQL